MKSPEYHEGPEALEQSEKTMTALFRAPKTVAPFSRLIAELLLAFGAVRQLASAAHFLAGARRGTALPGCGPRPGSAPRAGCRGSAAHQCSGTGGRPAAFPDRM